MEDKAIKADWECFCDDSYYHMWAVRKIGSKAFDEVIHVQTEQEAAFIVSQFNELDRNLTTPNRDRRRIYETGR